MEINKSQEVQSFLLGLILVLALVFVALEWNSDDSGWNFFSDDDTLEAELELQPLKRDRDEVPMMLPQEQRKELPQTERLRLVDTDVEETMPEDVVPNLKSDVADDEAEDKTEEQPQVVDMYDEPVDFRVVEELPQFPGGAVAFMKWLTKNLKYPASARQGRVKGKVVAQFIVNADGTVTDLELVQCLESSCDREVLRVLRMMPQWQAGLMNAKPCRTKVCIPIVFSL